MNAYRTILEAVLPVFGLIGTGFLLRRLEWLTTEADASLLRLTLYVFVPCLILDSALGNPAFNRWDNLLWAPLTGYATVALALVVASAARPWHGLTDPAAARTFAVTTAIHNYGYIPLPLCLLWFGKATAGVLFLYMVGVDAALWTLGVMGLSGASHRIEWRRVLNPALGAVVMSLILNGTRLNEWIPTPLHTALHWLGQCAVPLALLLIGAIMADELPQLRTAAGWRVMSVATLLRLGLFPLLFLAMARWLPITPDLQRVLVLEAAMPAAVFPIVMARHYRGDAATALRIVLSTSLVSLVTMPLWLRLGLDWIGIPMP